MATVYFDEATRIFSGGHAPAVDHVTLDIEDGEFLVLVGPSGCGKSTTLRMLAGLEPIDEGRILIDGHDQKGVRPRDRDVAMVFQSYALYPNMTAAENMAFALTNAKVASSEVKQRVAEAAKILELEQFLDRKPGALSGGQRQRVAMGRAIVRNPKVFCMDEPLSNLDAKLRVSTRSQIAGLQRRLGITTVYVTHDQVEAMTMGHRVAVLRDGRLQQVGTPEELYDRPVNTFVASFIGSPAITLVEATVRDGSADVHGARIPLDRTIAATGGGEGRRRPSPGVVAPRRLRDRQRRGPQGRARRGAGLRVVHLRGPGRPGPGGGGAGAAAGHGALRQAGTPGRRRGGPGRPRGVRGARLRRRQRKPAHRGVSRFPGAVGPQKGRTNRVPNGGTWCSSASNGTYPPTRVRFEEEAVDIARRAALTVRTTPDWAPDLNGLQVLRHDESPW